MTEEEKQARLKGIISFICAKSNDLVIYKDTEHHPSSIEIVSFLKEYNTLIGFPALFKKWTKEKEELLLNQLDGYFKQKEIEKNILCKEQKNSIHTVKDNSPFNCF